MAKEKSFKLKKTNSYKGSIRPVLNGDKKRAMDFDKGKAVKVTSDELEVIKKLGWGVLIPKEDK